MTINGRRWVQARKLNRRVREHNKRVRRSNALESTTPRYLHMIRECQLGTEALQIRLDVMEFNYGKLIKAK